MTGRFVDAAYPDRRILIELDSRRWHDGAQEKERDLERDVAANLAGWRQYRFRFKHVTEQPAWVVAVVRDARRLAAA